MRILFPILAAMTVASPALAQQATPPAADPAPSAICADRPTKSYAACTADPGSLQLETDLFNGTFQRQGGVTTDTWLYTNPTLKYGLTKTLDVEANIAPYVTVRTSDASGSHTENGVGDLYLRLKDQIYASADGNTQIALVPYLKAPTARMGIGNGAWEGGVAMPVNVKLDDKWTLTLSPEVDAFKDSAGDGRHANTTQTINIGYSLPADVTVYGELWADWNFDPARTINQLSLDFGVAKLIGKTLQIDCGVNLGLNDKTPGAQAYVGISKKW